MTRVMFLFVSVLMALFVTAGSVRAERVVALSADGTMRLLANPGCSGTACEWVDIDNNPRSIAVAATLEGIFQLHDNGAIWRWQGMPCVDGRCPSWVQVDANPQAVAIAADADDLFQLHRDGSIWRWLGGDCEAGRCRSWERVDRNPNTKAIAAAGAKLFQLHGNGSIWHWLGEPCSAGACSSWERLDNNPATREIDYAARGSLFQRHENGSIWRWDGRPCDGDSCRSWSMIDANPQTVDLLAAPGNLFQRHRNGSVWRWQGRACEGSSCPYWTRIGSNVEWRAIAAGPQPVADDFTGEGGGAAPVYAVAVDGTVSRWPGSACTGTCLDWTPVGPAFTRYSPSRGGLFVFEGNAPGRGEDLAVIPARPGDADGDGLPDTWEVARADWGLSPSVANLIFVPVLRPDVAESPGLMEALERNIERMTEHLRDLPVRTERGARGIQMVVREGNTLSDFYREDVVNALGYVGVRSVGMPSELIGYGHGMLIGVGTGGGGQTSGSDWSGVSNNFYTMIHELGHQLGLQHEPLGSGTPSPLYTSLMNYDYNYSFNGSGDLVHFSRGKFAGVRLDERRLNEVLPYPKRDLEFLERAPYNFSLEARAPANTSVDWNRNGVHGERNISADINDGYAVRVGPANHVATTTGDVAVAARGDILVAFTTEAVRADRESYDGRGASESSRARLNYTTVRDTTVLRTGRILGSPLMTGGPSAVEEGGRIVVAFPGILGTVQVGVYTIGGDGSLSGSLRVVNTGGYREVTVVGTNARDAVELILWDPATQRVYLRRVDLRGGVRIGDPRPVLQASGAPLTSATPPGAIFNTKTDRLMLVGGKDSGLTTDRLRLWTLDGSADAWRVSTERWLGGSGVRSPDGPAVVFDASPRAGDDGRYLVFYRIHPPADGDGRARLHVAKVTPPRVTGSAADAPYRTRERMYINEWTVSRNPPAATAYGDDFAVVWRTNEKLPNPIARNRAEVNLLASGEFSEGPADFDDVTFIAETGLWRSVTSVRP